MLCPYRKRIVSELPTFEKEIKGITQSEEMFAECSGDACPLFNAKMYPPCMRAVAERNKAYILVKREETFKGPWGN